MPIIHSKFMPEFILPFLGKQMNSMIIDNKEDMVIFMFRKKKKPIEFDRENQRAILKCSICTGEQVAGFKDKHTGKFQEVMLIRNNRELEEFMKMYDLDKVPKEY